MKYFNAKRFVDLKRMEAKALDRALGYTPRYVGVTDVQRTFDRLCANMVHDKPIVKVEAGRARGASEKRKGGVFKGTVFVTGEIARGRGAVFVTIGGSKLIKG